MYEALYNHLLVWISSLQRAHILYRMDIIIQYSYDTHEFHWCYHIHSPNGKPHSRSLQYQYLPIPLLVECDSIHLKNSSTVVSGASAAEREKHQL